MYWDILGEGNYSADPDGNWSGGRGRDHQAVVGERSVDLRGVRGRGPGKEKAFGLDVLGVRCPWDSRVELVGEAEGLPWGSST